VNNDKIEPAINNCIQYLIANEFIKLSDDGEISASALAEACLSAAVPPDQALKLLQELHKARQCFVLSTDLHIIYQVYIYI
jgi:DNA polymerase theta